MRRFRTDDDRHFLAARANTIAPSPDDLKVSLLALCAPLIGLRTDSASKVDLALTDDLTKAQHVIVWGGDRSYRTGHDHLYDAVMAATTLLARPRDPARRRALVAVTDDIEGGSSSLM